MYVKQPKRNACDKSAVKRKGLKRDSILFTHGGQHGIYNLSAKPRLLYEKIEKRSNLLIEFVITCADLGGSQSAGRVFLSSRIMICIYDITLLYMSSHPQFNIKFRICKKMWRIFNISLDVCKNKIVCLILNFSVIC